MDLKKIKIKFNKMKMDGIEKALDDIDYEKLKPKKIKNRNTPYEDKTNFKTIKEAFLQSVEKYSDNPCILEKLNHKESYKETTYRDFKEDVWNFGTALIEKLKLKDKRVIIIGETQYDWYVSYMAMLCGTGLAVPVDKELPLNELENVVRRSKASAIIYSQKKLGDINKLKEKVSEVEYFIEMKSDSALEGNSVGFKYLINEGKEIREKGNQEFDKIDINPDEFKILFFTSGTSSDSKGVMLCNRNLAENINAVTAYAKILPTDRLFSVLPLHHCYESTIGFLVPMACGASIAICEGLKYIVPNMQEAKPTIMLAVPLLVESLYKKINEKIIKSKKDKIINVMIAATNSLKAMGIDVKKKVFKEIYDNLGGNLRIIVSAAAPIDAKVGKWISDIGILFLQGYGLTETAPISALTPEYEPCIGSVGKPIVQADIKIDNPNENGEGEILIKSPTLMLGYYENEEKTKEVINSEGYFYSGDVGYIDENNNIFITGRSKNVIVTQNGKNIYPEEIEKLLTDVPEIKDVIVYGKKPDEEQIKKKDSKELIVTAKVVPNYEKIKELHGDVTEEETYNIIWEQIKENNKKLTSYKAIKQLEIKKEDFEKTSTMKIKRYKEITK